MILPINKQTRLHTNNLAAKITKHIQIYSVSKATSKVWKKHFLESIENTGLLFQQEVWCCLKTDYILY